MGSARSARSVTLAALAATILVSVPGLFAGFSSDDLTHRLALEGALPWYTGGAIGLYDFTPPSMQAPEFIEQGLFPWFSDPGLSLRFLRPLSSASLWLDHVLFGRNALLAHVQSLVWMLVLVVTASSLYRRWFTAPVALLASLVFAVSGAHTMPMSWVASRHTLVAAAFGLLSLWAWVRYRQDGDTLGAPLAVLLLIASLASSESGLVAVLLLAGHELGTRGLRRGLPSAALPLGIGVVYLGLYAALGYGARASGFYISPFNAPIDYAVAVFFGAPALLVELLLGVPALLAGMGGRPTEVVFLVLGVAALLGALLLFRALGNVIEAPARRTLGWLSAAALVGLGALVGTLVSGRVLPLPLFATAAVAGNALWGCWVLARGSAPPAAARARKRWWGPALLVALFQLLVPVLVRVGLPSEFAGTAEKQKRLAVDTDLGACAQGGSAYLINGSDPTLTLYAGAALLFYTPDKAKLDHLRVLSMAPQPQLLTRTARDAVRLDVLDMPRQHNPFERLFRAAKAPLLPGQSLKYGDLAVDIDGVSEGLFTSVRFRIDGGLDPARHCLLVWRDGRLENVAWPPLGESLRVEHQLGPMGL
jgi:hypothetical protein